MALSTAELNARLEQAARQLQVLRAAARELAEAGDALLQQRRAEARQRAATKDPDSGYFTQSAAYSQ